MYRNYITQAGNRASIGKAVRLIAASDAPVLVHCAAGKDRTGLTIALIHLTLGVSRADAYTEYLRSNEYTGRPAAVKAVWLRLAWTRSAAGMAACAHSSPPGVACRRRS